MTSDCVIHVYLVKVTDAQCFYNYGQFNGQKSISSVHQTQPDMQEIVKLPTFVPPLTNMGRIVSIF